MGSLTVSGEHRGGAEGRWREWKDGESRNKDWYVKGEKILKKKLKKEISNTIKQEEKIICQVSRKV